MDTNTDDFYVLKDNKCVHVIKITILRYLLAVICQRTKTKVDIWVLGIQHCVIFRLGIGRR